jgi:hypothetical protein
MHDCARMNNLMIMTYTVCHASYLVLHCDWLGTFTHLLFTFHDKQFGALPGAAEGETGRW